MLIVVIDYNHSGAAEFSTKILQFLGHSFVRVLAIEMNNTKGGWMLQ